MLIHSMASESLHELVTAHGWVLSGVESRRHEYRYILTHTHLCNSVGEMICSVISLDTQSYLTI